MLLLLLLLLRAAANAAAGETEGASLKGVEELLLWFGVGKKQRQKK